MCIAIILKIKCNLCNIEKKCGLWGKDSGGNTDQIETWRDTTKKNVKMLLW
jgi:hypothetical protein